MLEPASPPTGRGNDQEGGGDGEGIWEPRQSERGRLRREVGGGRVLIGGDSRLASSLSRRSGGGKGRLPVVSVMSVSLRFRWSRD